MSLLRLLTTGKALISLRDLPSAYQMRREALLPKFGSGGNPFVSSERAAAAEPAAASLMPEASGTTAQRSFWPWKAKGATETHAKAAKPGEQTTSKPKREARTPHQGELSLDSVKVVRNDLHGSDVDLVSTNNSGGTKYQQVASNLLSGANAAEQALDRLAERIVGAGVR